MEQRKKLKIRWNTKEINYLCSTYNIKPSTEIAEQLHRALRTIESKAYQLGLRESVSRINPKLIDQIKDALTTGDLSRAELAQRLGISYPSLFVPLFFLLTKGEIDSYKRKDIAGLGRAKVIYRSVHK